jgi:hypothetical protein
VGRAPAPHCTKKHSPTPTGPVPKFFGTAAESGWIAVVDTSMRQPRWVATFAALTMSPQETATSESLNLPD